MRADMDVALAEALARPGGAVGRGPHRYYVEIHAEQFRGFAELVTHPWVTAVCEGVLGPNYEIVELGFDVPLAGAENQPWHRDFPMPEVTRKRRELNSLAFNLTGWAPPNRRSRRGSQGKENEEMCAYEGHDR
jgi:hypothetical protein